MEGEISSWKPKSEPLGALMDEIDKQVICKPISLILLSLHSVGFYLPFPAPFYFSLSIPIGLIFLCGIDKKAG